MHLIRQIMKTATDSYSRERQCSGKAVSGRSSDQYHQHISIHASLLIYATLLSIVDGIRFWLAAELWPNATELVF
jgi:hypothetical protein